MSGFYVDMAELESIQRRMGGTRRQMILAYNAALRKTLRQLHLKSVAMMIELTGIQKRNVITRRTRQYATGGDKHMLRQGKIWFGLDDIPVSMIDGTISDTATPQQARQRDSKGRFIPGRTPGGVTFTPRSQELSAMSFSGAFVAMFRGKESIFERIPGSPHLREVKVPVMDAAVNKIDTGIYRQANTILLAIYQKELNGLIERGHGA